MIELSKNIALLSILSEVSTCSRKLKKESSTGIERNPERRRLDRHTIAVGYSEAVRYPELLDPYRSFCFLLLKLTDGGF